MQASYNLPFISTVKQYDYYKPIFVAFQPYNPRTCKENWGNFVKN